jgi:transcriptional regulator with XRE-family HTH domain
MNITPSQEKFVRRLDELMKEKGITPTILSKKTGIPRGSINNWRLYGGNPQLEYLYKLSDFFSCTVGYLIGKEEG